MSYIFTVEVIPFIVAILLGLMSPLTTKKIMDRIQKGLAYDGATNGQINSIGVYISYALDSVQIISSIIISLVTLFILPIFYREIGVISIIFLLFLSIFGLSIYYLARNSPYKIATKKLGPYSWVAVFSIALNIVILLLFGLDQSHE